MCSRFGQFGRRGGCCRPAHREKTSSSNARCYWSALLLVRLRSYYGSNASRHPVSTRVATGLFFGGVERAPCGATPEASTGRGPRGAPSKDSIAPNGMHGLCTLYVRIRAYICTYTRAHEQSRAACARRLTRRVSGRSGVGAGRIGPQMI